MPSVRIELPQAHPAFEGHFPGQPLLPGVVLLSEALERLLPLLPVLPLPAGTALRVPQLKFFAPVRPGAQLELRWSGDPAEAAIAGRGAGLLRFELWRHAPGDAPDGVLAASGQLDVSPGARA